MGNHQTGKSVVLQSNLTLVQLHTGKSVVLQSNSTHVQLAGRAGRLPGPTRHGSTLITTTGACLVQRCDRRQRTTPLPSRTAKRRHQSQLRIDGLDVALRRLIREGFESGIPGEQLAEASRSAAPHHGAAAHRYSSTVAVERMSRCTLLTDPRKAYTADRTQRAIMTINIGSQLVRL